MSMTIESATNTTPSNSKSTRHGMSLRMQQFLSVLLGSLVIVVIWSVVAEYDVMAGTSNISPLPAENYNDVDYGTNLLTASEDEYNYPENMMSTDWSTFISEQELLHLSTLHTACGVHNQSVISSQFGRNGFTLTTLINASDPYVVQKLSRCPAVDIFITAGLRSFGYCEDAAAYTKFLQARMLPKWVLKESFYDSRVGRNVTYHELCPTTPMIFFNHYWDGVVDSPDWPKDKLLYLMPNIEMYELVAEHYWRADMVLCKSALCAKYVTAWYKQEGNPRNTRVFFTRHTTSNVALKARTEQGVSNLKPKDFTNIEFIHTAGTSNQKGTNILLNCWLKQPKFPVLHLYINDRFYKGAFEQHYGDKIASSRNVQLHAAKLSAAEFGKVITEASFFMCPSIQEGYGHYINQARASKGLIVTTDVAPMNELITSASGVLIPSATISHKEQFLGGTSSLDHALKGVPGFVADVKSKDICASVAYVLNVMTPQERERKANVALQQYYYDTVFFAQKMQQLRNFSQGKMHQLQQQQQQHLRQEAGS